MTNYLPDRPRRFLFLQGMATSFLSQLGCELNRRGHRIYRINFNGGDRIFWSMRPSVDFRGTYEEWQGFLEQRLTEWGITDIVLFGDCRPLHQVAVRIALLRHLLVHVFEEGYLRPNWITHELGGVNGNSSLPRDADWFREQAGNFPPWTGGIPVRSSFLRRAVDDVVYNLGSTILAWRFPHYRTHRPWPFYVEYASWLRRIVGMPLAKRRLAVGLRKVAARHEPYFVFPLQLDSDFQVRQHSPHRRMRPVIEQVLASFCAHAPSNALLVIKEHPLDNAICDWRSMIHGIASRLGVSERAIYLRGGNLDQLLSNSTGIVTVNSTVGFLALSLGRPVIALGTAVYDIPDLTFQGGLDAFWRDAVPPDTRTFDAFRRVVAGRTQVNGGFFGASALRLAVAGAITRIEGTRLENALTINQADTPLRPPELNFASPARA
jgi:capsular polysaccharide export protein